MGLNWAPTWLSRWCQCLLSPDAGLLENLMVTMSPVLKAFVRRVA